MSSPCAQEMLGSCTVNHGWLGEDITYNEIISVWNRPVHIVRGMICCVMRVPMGSLSTVVMLMDGVHDIQ